MNIFIITHFTIKSDKSFVYTIINVNVAIPVGTQYPANSPTRRTTYILPNPLLFHNLMPLLRIYTPRASSARSLLTTPNSSSPVETLPSRLRRRRPRRPPRMLPTSPQLVPRVDPRRPPLPRRSPRRSKLCVKQGTKKKKTDDLLLLPPPFSVPMSK